MASKLEMASKPEMLSKQEDEEFLVEVLKKISNSQGNLQAVYKLLKTNLHRFNDDFALLLRKLATEWFASLEQATAINIARPMVQFSHLMRQCSAGNTASNISIAIAGYESTLLVFTRETFPQDWAIVQESLTSAYQQQQSIVCRTIEQLKQDVLKTKINFNSSIDRLKQELQLSKQHIPPRQEKFNTVILYDIENLTRGNKNPVFNFSLKSITEQVKTLNGVERIANQCAYADWSNPRFRALKSELQKLGIEAIQIFGFSNQKNAADIQLTIDAVELIHRSPSLQVFVIVSGDGAFASLAKKLHEYGKTVIGCAYKKQTNHIFESVCDNFIWVNIQQVDEKVNNNSKEGDRSHILTDEGGVLDFIRNDKACSNMFKNNGGINLGQIGKILKDKIPEFDYKKRGFKTLKLYLDSIFQGTEFKIVFADKKKTQPVVRSVNSKK